MSARTGVTVLVWLLTLILFVSSIVVAMGLKEEKTFTKKTVIVKLYVYNEGLMELDLEEYLQGVIAAELPASFHTEALKAQAVAARTYTLKRLDGIKRTGSRYPLEADITNLPYEGQAWISIAERKQRWQTAFDSNQEKIAQAVLTTSQEVLTYQGALAEALYCSTAGPYTEDAQAVFKVQTPYLKAQPNPYDKHSPRYTDQKIFSITELEKALGIKLKAGELTLAASLPQGPDVVMAATLLEPWLNPDKKNSALKILSRNRSGRVEQLLAGERIFSGVEVRNKLGLRSTNFTFKVSLDSTRITFSTLGYGHGVGMSQYGADGMARQGFNYKEILNFYYPGTDVVSFTQIWE